ncbi:MAG: phage holin family protein [Chlorobiales bacterium]|nr:phage holin family protein [Chlorobiales bacterium]
MNDQEKLPGRKGLQPQTTTSKSSSIPSLIEDAVSNTYKDILEIVSAKIELAKLEVTEQLAVLLSNFIVLTIALAGLIYLGAAFSIFLGEVTGYKWLGYLIIGLVFLICVLVFGKLRPEWLRSLIERSILKKHHHK